MDLTAVPPSQLDIDPADVPNEYRARGLDALGDEQLFDTAARVVSIPKRDPADSFVLHAPLELLARRTLLRFVAPDRRESVREQIIRVAATYERASEPVERTFTDAHFESPAA